MTPNRMLPLLTLFAACAGMLATPAWSDMPKRKSGLWEMTMAGDGHKGPQGRPASFTMQTCVDAAQDDMFAPSGKEKKRDMRQKCSKMDVHESGGKTIVDAVCQVDDHTTATSHSIISGSLASQYRMESDVIFNPPMHGMEKTHSVVTAKWLGPCKPGQTHGTTIISGMGAKGGTAPLQIDPEAMKKMNPEMLKRLNMQ